jgi:hypothetical protein
MAVPILVRRIALMIDAGLAPRIPRPIRVPATRLRMDGVIEHYISIAANSLQGWGGILVIVDCDWDGGCPATDGPALLQRAKTVRSDLPIAVVLAKKEFEAWFLAAAESLRGKRGLPPDLEPPNDPESIRGAKEWLRDRMPPGRTYSETSDQPAFTHEFDLNAARGADSFDKCFREIDGMLRLLRAKAS